MALWSEYAPQDQQSVIYCAEAQPWTGLHFDGAPDPKPTTERQAPHRRPTENFCPSDNPTACRGGRRADSERGCGLCMPPCYSSEATTNTTLASFPVVSSPRQPLAASTGSIRQDRAGQGSRRTETTRVHNGTARADEVRVSSHLKHASTVLSPARQWAHLHTCRYNALGRGPSDCCGLRLSR